ncbi:DUF2255 family protein [Pseudomonas viridiflava]|uniref:DUF2255 family protein n=1 Tax=Pseudomonas viridiflava TaxID=33069 RepID=UPI001F11BE13|nr:DUF2255 family protein [Pseudomonas viridiflava]
MAKKTLNFNSAAALLVATFSVPAQLWAASDDKNADLQRMTEQRVGTHAWSEQELQRIIKADDLKVSPFREDGVTYGTPTWVWCVEVDSALYVRAYNGTGSRWYQAAVREKAGQIIAAGMTRKVNFEAVEGDVNRRIDDAYRTKYSTSPYLEPMISAQARAATVRITPSVASE